MDYEGPMSLMGLMGLKRPIRSAGPAAHVGTVASRGRESAGAAGTTNAGVVLNHEWTRMDTNAVAFEG